AGEQVEREVKLVVQFVVAEPVVLEVRIVLHQPADAEVERSADAAEVHAGEGWLAGEVDAIPARKDRIDVRGGRTDADGDQETVIEARLFLHPLGVPLFPGGVVALPFLMLALPLPVGIQADRRFRRRRLRRRALRARRRGQARQGAQGECRKDAVHAFFRNWWRHGKRPRRPRATAENINERPRRPEKSRGECQNVQTYSFVRALFFKGDALDGEGGAAMALQLEHFADRREEGGFLP